MGKLLKDIVTERLTELGRNPFEAARIGGLHRSFVNDIVIERKKSVRGDNLIKLAKALDLTPEEVIGEIKPKQSVSINNEDRIRPIQVPVRGETAAGRWFEHDDMIDDEPEPIPAVPGRYSHLEQFAYRIVGPSMDKRRIEHHDYVLCVPYFDVRTQPETGDTVIVERRRGQLVERTCKEFVVTSDGYELWPRSADPRFQDPIKVKNSSESIADDGTEIEIVGLVVAIHVPILK